MIDQFLTIRHILDAHGCEVIDPSEGTITCPGIHLHTTPNANSDCKVWFNDDGTVIAHCLHQSCRCHKVRPLNLDLMSHAFTGGAHLGVATDASDKRKTGDGEDVLREAKDALPEIIANWPWSAAEMVHDSPESIGDVCPEDQWRALLGGLFEPDDIVWCGRDLYDCGSPNHRWRFRAVREWLNRGCPGLLTCPSTFRPGTYVRGNDDVDITKCLVIESDHLTHDECGALFRYLQACELTLRAIVDTGGKSLHGWFDYPTPSQMTVLQTVLPLLGGDGAMFTPSQPCRLPGAIRPETGRYQRLIYLNPRP